MPAATKTRPASEALFEPEAVYTPQEIAERLKTTPRQVRRYIYDGRFSDGGVLDLPRGRRVYGWALNEFVSERTF